MRLAVVAALAAIAATAAHATAPAATVHLPVPLIRQAPERCGPAALAMVLRYYGADSAALAETERAYDPVLRGALITDLAAAARRAGFDAAVETPDADSLVALLEEGVPPVLLVDRGVGPLERGHYAVAVGWDAEKLRYLLHDGGAHERWMARSELLKRWKPAGSRALIVRRP
jgi:ABC-type bacteriocin/lantibiotic exporter with double-glycine peptidase domain